MYYFGISLICIAIIYALIRHKGHMLELSRFVTIALLLFALPRLILLLYHIIMNDDSIIFFTNAKIELTLGITLLLIRCIQEILKLCK